MSPAVSAILADLKRRYADLYGPRLVNLLLFGSHARGDAQPGSDVDVLVVLKGRVSPSTEIERTMKDAADVSLSHGVTISCVFVSQTEYARGRSPLLLNVRREGVLL